MSYLLSVSITNNSTFLVNLERYYYKINVNMILYKNRKNRKNIRT